ncbi:MAG: FAD binding domain-containing protein, partial [Firmicutes bacterium]|nr:FAD binding domain-containing protein [Bacillota bacterium]
MIFTVPKTLEELQSALANRSERFVFAAGCTDILPKKLGKPWEVDEIIDLTHVPQLQAMGVGHQTGDYFIGACCTHAQVAADPEVRRHYTALAQACEQIGSVQIRNRGTIGGNVANASPAADTMPCLMLFGAEREVIGENGECITGFCLPLPEDPSAG